MTDIVVPFNHQPVSVSVETSSYTIPAGKYARVTVSLSSLAYVVPIKIGSGGSSDAQVQHFGSDSGQKTATFFLPEGAVLGVSTTTASGSDSGASKVSLQNTTGVSSASFSIDGTPALEVKSYIVGAYKDANNSATDYTNIEIAGDADARYIVEIFNNIT